MFIRDGNFIRSSTGFTVEGLGRTGLRYREGDRSILIDAEVLSNGIAVITRPGLHWDPPYQHERLHANDQSRIIANICSAYASVGEPITLCE
jgi:hypothetical protein